MRHNLCEELKSYALLEGSEWSEAMLALCHLKHYSHLLHADLVKEIDSEIADQLNYVKDHARVVEETETYTSVVKTLEWND